MTSRDFGITTLRNAVAYHFDGSIVPLNNVYLTSTNGAAIFSDTLTISTINVSTATISTLTVSTIDGGGGGGGILAVNAGTNISIPDPLIPVVSVYINSMLDMNGYGISSCNLMSNNIGNGNITISANEELNMGSNNLLTLASNVVNVTATGDNINMTAGKDVNISTFNNNNNINLTVGSTGKITATGSTLINGSIKVASTFYDNNISSGTAGQVITAGNGGQVIWSTITGGGVESVLGSSNISITGTGTTPIVNALNLVVSQSAPLVSQVSNFLVGGLITVGKIPYSIGTFTVPNTGLYLYSMIFFMFVGTTASGGGCVIGESDNVTIGITSGSGTNVEKSMKPWTMPATDASPVVGFPYTINSMSPIFLTSGVTYTVTGYTVNASNPSVMSFPIYTSPNPYFAQFGFSVSALC